MALVALLIILALLFGGFGFATGNSLLFVVLVVLLVFALLSYRRI